ncbi:SDR family NAD(P)-dependent oxidoreductase [Pseudonocardia alni]|uniref:SDR family NAD(P)-dependent oxidoreductase n=1 Tax=Pseudonocardia alni TaxID=33907 RepID=UPI0033D68F4B
MTGAAGGIGRATVDALAGAGLRVLGIDVDEAVLRLDRDGPGRSGVVADHRDLASVEEAMGTAAALGPIRHVVALAGTALPEEIELGDRLPHPDVFRASVELNLLGHVNVVWAARQYLFRSGGDRSVTLCSSVNALQGWGEPAYSTAKAGHGGLVRSLAGSFGAQGVRINAVAPGTTDTPTLRAEYADRPDHFARMRETVPLGRLGLPGQVAGLLLALARDLTHMTGQVLIHDGGQTVHR